MSVDQLRDFWEKHAFKRNGAASLLLAFEDKENTESLFNRLREYSIRTMAKGAVAALDDTKDTEHYYIDPQYNETQLDLLEDVWRNDGAVKAAVRKYNRAIMTKHGKTVVDTALEFNNEQERRKKVTELNGGGTDEEGKPKQGNTRYKVAKQKVDKILTSRDVNFHHNYSELRENRYVYGRAAAYKHTDPLTGLLSGLELLDPKRLGRVKVHKITKKIVAVEYMDTIKLDNGQAIIALEGTTNEKSNIKIEPSFIPIDNLIYLVKSDGGNVRNSRYVGVSGIESCIHISQVKRIILNEMLKEASKALYAGQGRVFFPPDTPDGMMNEFIDMIKRNVGRWFGYKIPGLEIATDMIQTAIEKYEPVVDLINREILRTIGLASFLVGYEQIANYANSEQIMLGTKELDIHFERTEVKDDIKYGVLDELFFYFIKEGDPFGSKMVKNEQMLRINPKAKMEELEPYDPKEEKEYTERFIQDQDVKLTYEFEEINFSTRLESAQAAAQIKTMIPYIPDEALLKMVGLTDYIEETMAAKDAYEEKELEKQKLQFDHETNMAKMRGSTTVSKKPTASKNVAAAASADDYMEAAINSDNPEIKNAILEMIRTRTEAYKQFLKK